MQYSIGKGLIVHEITETCSHRIDNLLVRFSFIYHFIGLRSASHKQSANWTQLSSDSDIVDNVRILPVQQLEYDRLGFKCIGIHHFCVSKRAKVSKSAVRNRVNFFILLFVNSSSFGLISVSHVSRSI